MSDAISTRGTVLPASVGAGQALRLEMSLPQRERRVYERAKRLLDIVATGAGLLMLAPLFALVAIAIRLDSSGAVLFSQTRVGRHGRTFRCWKFRSMFVDAEARKAALMADNEMDGGVIFKMKRDPRITRVGRFIRKASIDELPQLWNVFTGDMSLVGPRPERPVFIQEFRSRIPRYMLRHKVPAGITGWAQINGWRGDTSIDKRIEYDLYYIEHWSLLLDLKILCMTPFRGFASRNAY